MLVCANERTPNSRTQAQRLQELTVGRANFRVHPATATEDGVSGDYRRRRALL